MDEFAQVLGYLIIYAMVLIFSMMLRGFDINEERK